jgi:hypothetical protein
MKSLNDLSQNQKYCAQRKAKLVTQRGRANLQRVDALRKGVAAARCASEEQCSGRFGGGIE